MNNKDDNYLNEEENEEENKEINYKSKRGVKGGISKNASEILNGAQTPPNLPPKSDISRSTCNLLDDNGLVAINQLDHDLFEILLHQGCLSLELIFRRFVSVEELKLKKRPSLYYRLYRLQKAGYIRTASFGGRNLYFLASKGWDEIRYRNQIEIPLIGKSESINVAHDLACSTVRFYLESIGGKDWFSDRAFRQTSADLARIPDGAIGFGDRTIFVEVEFTRKSNERYRMIADFYKARKGTTLALYFYNDFRVVKPLISIIEDHPSFAFFPYSNPLRDYDELFGESSGQVISLKELL
jgi:DNA-binding PadR family transcriptional regulator